MFLWWWLSHLKMYYWRKSRHQNFPWRDQDFGSKCYIKTQKCLCNCRWLLVWDWDKELACVISMCTYCWKYWSEWCQLLTDSFWNIAKLDKSKVWTNTTKFIIFSNQYCQNIESTSSVTLYLFWEFNDTL